MNEFIEKLIGRLEEYSDKSGLDNGKKEIMRNIVNQLAEEYNNGWIPCSERLPDEFGFYLVSRKDCIISDMALYNPKFKQWDSDDIIAWQPRPESYQPKNL